MPKTISIERLMKDIRRILNSPFWIPDLSTDEVYERLNDDIDGILEGKFTIQFSKNGDVWLSTDTVPYKTLRYRMSAPLTGGGCSPRTRNALLILAYATMLDNKENPDPK